MDPRIFSPRASHPTRLLSQLLLLSSALCWAGAALAEPTTKQEAAGAPSSQGAAAAQPKPAEPESYRTWLTVAYALSPLLARMIGNVVWHATKSEAAAIAVAVPGLAVPAGVHAYHAGIDRAAKSFGLMLSATAAGAAAFGGLGYYLGSANCSREDQEIESCDHHAESFAVPGAVAGAALGYLIFAVYDVINNANVPAPPAAVEQGGTASVWLSPFAPAPPERAGSAAPGLQLGAAVRF